MTERIEKSHEESKSIICPECTKVKETRLAHQVEFSLPAQPIFKAGGVGGFYRPSVSTTAANSDKVLSQVEQI